MEFLQSNTRRLVIKIGTNSLTKEDGSIEESCLESIASQIQQLRLKGIQVVLVSSGAVGLGMSRLKISSRPSELDSLQACAAIGQGYLINQWQGAFSAYKMEIAQVLLTREDVRGRKRHLAVKRTLNRLLDAGVIPIVNENDTVSAEEIKFGDNDILSALTASLIGADLLVILSTIQGLLDPQNDNQLVPLVREINDSIQSMAGGSLNDRSTGGMVTKLEAAQIATRSGCGVFIGSAQSESILEDLIVGRAEGTFFVPQKIPMAAKKRWMAYFEKPCGQIIVDNGAVDALKNKGSSLLPKGIKSVRGNFEAGEVVEVMTNDGILVARGLVEQNYSTLKNMLGLDSTSIKKAFPKLRRTVAIHRNHLVVF